MRVSRGLCRARIDRRHLPHANQKRTPSAQAFDQTGNPECSEGKFNHVYRGGRYAAAGFTFGDIRKWGGEIHLAPRPSDPARRATIESGTVNAIFDEGIKSWAGTALDHGFNFLPVEGAVLKRLGAMGYRPAVMPKSRFPGMAEDITTIDFS